MMERTCFGIDHLAVCGEGVSEQPSNRVGRQVVDIGLAKAMDPAGTSSANAMNSPTLSMHATQTGIILSLWLGVGSARVGMLFWVWLPVQFVMFAPGNRS